MPTIIFFHMFFLIGFPLVQQNMLRFSPSSGPDVMSGPIKVLLNYFWFILKLFWQDKSNCGWTIQYTALINGIH